VPTELRWPQIPPGEERPEKRRETAIGTIAREDPAPGEERPERRVT
jgi:hypothetical protein